MAKSKVREITIKQSKSAFSILLPTKSSSPSYNFSGISALRQLLSNEKAKILDTIKTQKPKSIYELSKKLNRGFKSVNDDIKLLQRFGFIDLLPEKTKNRTRLKPVLLIDKITINIVI